MKLASYYSHFNGLEWLVYHHPNYWDEIKDVIATVDAEACKTKVSKEKTMAGKLLYSPPEMNSAFKRGFREKQWNTAGRTNYFVADDAETNKELLKLSFAQQKQYLEDRGKPLIETYNSADFKKGRVSVEVQFGKYSFVQFDLFVKHTADFMHNRIDLGVEIVPTKSLELQMSSGPPYFEKHLHEIVRQGRTFPPVPLLLIGVEP